MKNKVPKLRFPEFSGEWEEKKLGEISEISSGLTPLRSEKKYFENGDIPWIKTTDLNNGNILKSEELITAYALEKTTLKLLPKNTVLIAMYGGFNQIGRTGLTQIETTINQAISALILKRKYSSQYILQYLNGFREKWKQVAASSRKDPNITKKDVENFKISISSLPEQEKIANFLSSVDIKIEKLEKKKELLEKYKKGMMQKLFSQKLRFKDENGNYYPEWEEKKLGEILIKNSRKNKGNKISKVQSISNKSGFINQEELFQDRIIASMDKKNYYIIEKGMFAYNPSRIDVGSLAYKEENELVVISPLYISFKAIREKILDLFLLEWFDSYKFKQQMQKSFEGSVRNTLSYEALSKILILFPSLPEQEKIANFLSSIDRKIELVEEELEKNKEFKKGLLQQMFV